jgi:hypothetical protein
MAGRKRSNPADVRLHKLSTLECPHVCLIERKPFPVLALTLKSAMPIALDAEWIIGANGVDCRRFIGKLDRQFAFPTANRVGLPNFVVTSRFD